MPGKLVGDLIGYLMAVTPPVQIVIQKGEDYHSFRLPMDEVALSDWGFSGEELRPFSEASQQECSKIVAWHETQDLVKVYQGLSNRYGGRVNTFLTDSGRWLQMMSREASKERALLDLLALRGIPPEKVVVWGDDTPDLGMFRTFGCSVAMANAPAVLRNAATYVTRSNDEDGVAFALEEYLGLR
jgi:hydroxymethylpyrimidine pyrophosphatase-like HAD family hydrolase